LPPPQALPPKGDKRKPGRDRCPIHPPHPGGLRSVAAAPHAPSHPPFSCPSALTEQRPPSLVHGPNPGIQDHSPPRSTLPIAPPHPPSPSWGAALRRSRSARTLPSPPFMPFGADGAAPPKPGSWSQPGNPGSFSPSIHPPHRPSPSPLLIHPPHPGGLRSVAAAPHAPSHPLLFMPFGADGAAPPKPGSWSQPGNPGSFSPSIHPPHRPSSSILPILGGLRSVAAAPHAPSHPLLSCPSALTEQRPPSLVHGPNPGIQDHSPPRSTLPIAPPHRPSSSTLPILGGCAPSQPLRTHPPIPSFSCPSALTEQRPPSLVHSPNPGIQDHSPPRSTLPIAPPHRPSSSTLPILGGCAPSQPLRTHPPIPSFHALRR
jgi:hypothetical protein